MLFNRCPTTEALYQYAVKPDSSRIAKHLEGCEGCRKALAEIQKEEGLLSELRAVRDNNVDGAVRQRLLSICRKVAAEQGNAQRDTAKKTPP
jgi:hypothetical protein